MKEAFRRLVARNVAIFVATGNNGFPSEVSSPACISNSIAVGATYDAEYATGGGFCPQQRDVTPLTIACFTNRGRAMDLLAPGLLISSSAVGGGVTKPGAGTSYASPMAAGVAALGISRGFGDSLGRSLVRDTGGGLLRVLGVGAVLLAGSPTSFRVAAGFAAGSVTAELLFAGYVAAKGWLSPAARVPTGPLMPALRPHAATEVLSQSALWLDVVVLGALASPAVVGLYGIARGLTRVLDLVRHASSHGYLPAASTAFARGEGARIPALHVSTRRFAFALVWPVLATCLLAPGPLLGLLFGPTYEAAAPALRLLALASFVSSFFDYLDLVLVAERRPGDVLGAGVAGVVSLAALLAALVPLYGGEGAALALLGSSVLRGLILHLFCFRSRPFRPFLPAIAGPAILAAASLAAGAILLQALRPEPLAALVLAAGAGAAASAVALLWFFRERGTGVGSSPP